MRGTGIVSALLLLLPLAGLSACEDVARLPRTEGVSARDAVDGPLSLGRVRLKGGVCSGIDLQPEYGTLDERAVIEFLKRIGLPTRTVPARSDLIYVDFQLNPDRDEWTRLRVAILANAPQAGAELHRALLEHGPGWWGVHRGNLAVLGRVGDLDDIVAAAAKTKLACWGVLTIAGRDDAFVIPGGYREL